MTFKPHLWVLHERSRPSQVTIVGLIGVDRCKKIWLQETVVEESQETQEETIHRAVAAYDDEASKPGRRFFGEITGYLYRPTPDQSFPVATDGAVTWTDQGAVREPLARASIR